MKRLELLTTLQSLKRRFQYDIIDKSCIKVKAKIININHPLVYIIEDDGKRYYLSKLHFYVEHDKICYIHLRKLKEDDEIVQKIKSEWAQYYATHKAEDVYKSINMPHQVFYRIMKTFPMLEKRHLLSNHVEDIPFEELMQAYANNTIEYLAGKYNMKLKYIYKMFLEKLLQEKRKLKIEEYSYRLYPVQKATSSGVYCYIYKPQYNEKRKRVYPVYYGKCKDISQEEILQAQAKQQELKDRIKAIEKIIDDVRLKIRNLKRLRSTVT